MGKKNWMISPLCWDINMLKYINQVAYNHWIDMEVMLGISFSESHLWTNFAPSQDCSKMHNWWGIKAKKNDDWTTERYKLPYSGCRLYPFQDMKAYWNSLANTISMWYVQWWCDNLKCLSAYYVGSPWTVKQSWVDRVSYFIYYK